MPGPDLHVHSTASDGTLTPTEIVRRAATLGIPAVALTDHDSVDGVAEAVAAASGTGVSVVPALELSAGLDGHGIHILGYHIDHTDPTLLRRLAELQAVRIARAERIVDSLASAGLSVTMRDVLHAAEGGAVGRAHIARALVEAGHAGSVAEAFDRLLGSGRRHFVPKPLADAAEVISWISQAGGIAVLAHPALSRADGLVGTLVGYGILGIEAYHARHDAATRERYLAIARGYGLIATGGSDFHGDVSPADALGSADVPGSVLDDLERVRRAVHAGEGPR